MGVKTLISSNYYSEEELWQIFHREEAKPKPLRLCGACTRRFGEWHMRWTLVPVQGRSADLGSAAAQLRAVRAARGSAHSPRVPAGRPDPGSPSGRRNSAETQHVTQLGLR